MRNLVAARDVKPQPTRVVVVGGGAAGVIAAVHLLRSADAANPVDVRIVEKDGTIGPGLPYRSRHRRHTLNNFAARLSAIEDDPDHLLRWCAARGLPADPHAFLPRHVYGAYLTAVLDDTDVPSGSCLHRNRGVVVGLEDRGRPQDGPRHASDDGLVVRLHDGSEYAAEAVVLALGTPPPRHRPPHGAESRYVANPWAPDLEERVAGAREVLLLGTGLTMVDVVAQLNDAFPTMRFCAASRHGLLPLRHRRNGNRIRHVFHPGPAPLDVLERRVRARVRELQDGGGDWRDVVDSVRAVANHLWRGLSVEEQARFVDDLARCWEVARHRMAPDMADHVDRLRRSGTLAVRPVTEVDVTAFDRVVDCTGPAPVPTRGWNALVDSLLDNGTVRPHPLGLGLDLDQRGRVVDAAGQPNPRLYAVGAARRGLEWEVAAVPDLRGQAARLAAHIVAPRLAPTASTAYPA